MNTYFVHYKCHAKNGFEEAIVESNIAIDFKSDILTTEDIREFEQKIIDTVFPDVTKSNRKKITLTICNIRVLK